MKQELYINGQKADIKEDSLILFTYQQSDYSDPTAVKNSYTKSVTLPGTPNNHRIFNEIYRLDYFQNQNLFNPSKRTQFEIISNGTLLEQGYLKLTKITGQGEYREYQISLYGGLGDFMYSLQYDYEGNKLSMYNIVSYDYADLDFTINRQTIKEAWDWINGDRKKYSKWSEINFAPCYNGLPECDNFDNKKIALYCGDSPNTFTSPVYLQFISEGQILQGLPAQTGNYQGYRDRNNHYWSLIKLPEGIDEWQVGDHRSWMQRPMFSVKFLFSMIENYLRETVNPKFTMELDESWFNDQNPYWNDIWITLPLLYENKEGVKSGDNITHNDLFKKTKTPYEYLTSYTKSFGLWYDYDTTTRVLTITPRYKFYDPNNPNVINIENKIDRGGVKIDPLSFSFRTLRYEWKEGEDNISENYKKNTNDTYGVYGVDTGWEFDNSAKVVPTNQIMKNAIDVREKSPYYSTTLFGYGLTTHPSGGYEIMPSWCWSNDIKYILYNKNQSEDQKIYENVRPDFTAAPDGLDNLYSGYMMNGVLTGDRNQDGVYKPNFHNDENKTVDGSDVFLLYTGKDMADRWYKASQNTTYTPLGDQQINYISDDVDGFETMHDDKHMWINTTHRTGYQSIPYTLAAVFPKFNRMHITNKTVDYSLDLGKPAQTYVYPDIEYDDSATISRKTFLDDYISDLYNVNTRLVETRMKIENPHKAMRSVFFFDNSLWVINKMTDFNYENNLTTVQFIKVNDIDNYVVKLPHFIYGFDENYPIDAYWTIEGKGHQRQYLGTIYSDKIMQYNYTSDYPWLSGESGFDDGRPYIQVNWIENKNFNPRKGYITMNYRTYYQNVWVRQDGQLTPTPKTINIDNGAHADYVYFNVKIDPDVFNFTIKPSADWLRAELEQDGNKVAVYVAANTTGEDRSGTIDFHYRYTTYITINQSK